MKVNNKQVVLDMRPLDEILSSMPEISQGDLIPLLQQIQSRYGYLRRDVVCEMSRRTKIAVSRIYGVATFYEQFHLEPHGRHTIKCCRGTACHVKGAPEITEAITRVTGVSPGETTDDMKFTFETVACLGTCFLAPVIMIDDDYFGHLTVNKVEGIITNYE
ncbi:MAG: NADH-quinone oxidoreductase subunit NuoE [Planctomycetes bacterium]|nr:NADH-quinone oxidoreductase subunit NuoE [Planctomycetota bacterium]